MMTHKCSSAQKYIDMLSVNPLRSYVLHLHSRPVRQRAPELAEGLIDHLLLSCCPVVQFYHMQVQLMGWETSSEEDLPRTLACKVICKGVAAHMCM